MTSLSQLVRAILFLGLMVFGLVLPAGAASQAEHLARATVVLVHGAFAESASWNAVAHRLRGLGFPVIGVANPLRGLKSDAAYVKAVVASVKGPVVLVGHSYGGSVISVAADGLPNVKALVFVAAFAPEVGESAIDLSSRFPGSTLGQALAAPVVLPDGGKELSIAQDKFRDQFAADVSAAAASVMAVGQRPVTEGALGEPAPAAAWKSVPSWFVYGDRDKNIPPAAVAFMAERANARKTVAVAGASHVVMVSRPAVVARLIVEAADSVRAGS